MQWKTSGPDPWFWVLDPLRRWEIAESSSAVLRSGIKRDISLCDVHPKFSHSNVVYKSLFPIPNHWLVYKLCKLVVPNHCSQPLVYHEPPAVREWLIFFRQPDAQHLPPSDGIKIRWEMVPPWVNINGMQWIPSGKLTELLKITIYSGFSHEKWWFSIAMLNYQRVEIGFAIFNPSWSHNFVWVFTIKKPHPRLTALRLRDISHVARGLGFQR